MERIRAAVESMPDSDLRREALAELSSLESLRKWMSAVTRPMDGREGDPSLTAEARASLRSEMESHGWDVYGGSSDPAVVAMNHAWMEGYLVGYGAGRAAGK